MPVRSLNSSVLVWPKQDEVESAVTAWAQKTAESRPDLLLLGYFGSYAKGNWGVGSDLDIVAVVEKSKEPTQRRSIRWTTNGLPVPVDLFVFTLAEWDALMASGRRFARMLPQETRWIYRRPGFDPSSHAGNSGQANP